MPDMEQAAKAIEAEILRGINAAVVSHSLEPDSHGAGFDSGFVAGLVQALAILRGSAVE